MGELEEGEEEEGREGGGVDVLNVGPRLLIRLLITCHCVLLLYPSLAAALIAPHGRYRSVCVDGEEEQEEGEG